MTLAHLYRTIQDEDTGELLIGASVALCSPGTQTPISNPIFADAAMTQQLSNPFVSESGLVDVYLNTPITVLVQTSYGASVTVSDYVQILPLAEALFTSPTPLTIANSPGTDLYLRGIDTENVEWAGLDDFYSKTDDNLLGWFIDSAFVLSNIERDENGTVLNADVAWPDNNVGVYAADAVSGIAIGHVDAWHVTWTGSDTGRTYFQPSLTRDVNGWVTVSPTPVVVDSITDILPS